MLFMAYATLSAVICLIALCGVFGFLDLYDRAESWIKAKIRMAEKSGKENMEGVKYEKSDK